MIDLPQVTLVLVSGLGYRTDENIFALKYAQKGISFGDVKYIQLDSIKKIDDWNNAIIYELPKYIDTDFCLLVHENGTVVHPESWNPEWLKYDFIGSPWPLPQDDFSYRDEEGNIVRVGNSVSLRSKKLLNLAAQRPLLYRYGNNNEDGHITCWNRKWLESQGCKFAPIEVAKWFGRELEIPENQDVDKPFIFHYNKVYPGRNEQYRKTAMLK